VTTTDAAAPPEAAHPLALLTADEISSAVAIVRADERFPDDAVFAHVRLHEPPKSVVAAHSADTLVNRQPVERRPVEREVEALVVPRAGIEPVEVVVSVTAGTVRSWTPQPGMRPALLFGESFDAIVKVREHPDWQAALRRRGIDDFDAVQLDPWPAGSFGVEHEDGRRISRVLSYLRHSKEDNGYAHPIEGVVAFFDMGGGEERGFGEPLVVGPVVSGRGMRVGIGQWDLAQLPDLRTGSEQPPRVAHGGTQAGEDADAGEEQANGQFGGSQVSHRPSLYRLDGPRGADRSRFRADSCNRQGPFQPMSTVGMSFSVQHLALSKTNVSHTNVNPICLAIPTRVAILVVLAPRGLTRAS
jgi:hypothetical protein